MTKFDPALPAFPAPEMTQCLQFGLATRLSVPAACGFIPFGTRLGVEI